MLSDCDWLTQHPVTGKPSFPGMEFDGWACVAASGGFAKIWGSLQYIESKATSISQHTVVVLMFVLNVIGRCYLQCKTNQAPFPQDKIMEPTDAIEAKDQRANVSW